MLNSARLALTVRHVSLGLLVLLIPASVHNVGAQQPATRPLTSAINRQAQQVETQVITWRRDIHQHPELSNREFRTAKLVADHLRQLGIEVRTGVAHTGVVGLLRGAKATPVVALRADMDALPVTEAVDLPFASKATTVYEGKEVGVMHACGHDAHTAILMGVAKVLSTSREKLPGTVKFIFQPAEEGPPTGEEGGAKLMIREGVLENPKPDAIFGLHVFPWSVGKIAYRSGATMASSDGLHIVVRGRQTHGGVPWGGIDPITVTSQIVLGLQTVVSRQLDVTAGPAIISIGSIHGGVRSNIIPDEVEMRGTIRTLNPEIREVIHQRIRTTAEGIAQSSGATAEVTFTMNCPVTVNDPDLTRTMVPVLHEVVGPDNVFVAPLLTVAEDFAFYQQQIPGLFFFLGAAPKGTAPGEAAPNHSPHFYVDEDALAIGVRALSQLAVAYLESE